MRFPRVKADGQGFDHCVSKVVARRFIFQARYGPARCQALQQELKSVFDRSASLGFVIFVSLDSFCEMKRSSQDKSVKPSEDGKSIGIHRVIRQTNPPTSSGRILISM
jgi:hypothetical protein